MDKTQRIQNKKIALTWWSTWWHIFPLLSIYNYLHEKWEYDFIWVWEEWWLEEEVALKNKIEFLDIPAWKLRRYFDVRNFYEPLKNLTWIFFWVYYIHKYKIDIVFSKGWYVAIPLCIAAFIMRKDIYIHESDTVWGIANKIIWKIATKIFYTFPNEIIDDEKYILSWQILNPVLIDGIDNLNMIENPKLTIFVIWWSQWSTTIFNALIKIIPDLPNIEFHVVLWDKNLDFREKFKKFPNVLAHDFLTQNRMWKILKKSDIAITRWWATTLWELNMFWIHSIIIPLSESAWDHQNKNALYFKEKFKSDILDENNNLEINLFRKIQRYKDLRKSWLNLDWFFNPLKKIEEEIK